MPFALSLHNSVALLLVVGAVVLMMLPTYAMAWGAQDGRFISSVRWNEFLLVAHGNVVPILTIMSALAMAVGLAMALRRGRTKVWVGIPGLVSAVLLALFSYDSDDASFVTAAGVWVAPLIGLAGAMALAAWWLGRRASDSPSCDPLTAPSNHSEVPRQPTSS